MTAAIAPQAPPAAPAPLRRLWRRELPEYPTGARRIWYLGIVFATTVVAYYENFISGAVTPQLLSGFHISFLYFAVVTATANAIGAIGSLASGIADRVGRGNMAVVGLFGVSLVTLLAVPHATTGLQYGIAFGSAGIFEGVILVVTPALMRDFSPQVGRAQAMAFWTVGPVLGSLLVTEVSSHTLDSHPRWQFQFEVAGWAGLVVCVVALLFLRELDRADRDRIIGALEAETGAALGSRNQPQAATHQPYRQMLRLDIVGPAIGISLFLLMYYTAIGVLPVYFQTDLNFTASQSNSLLNWLWATTAVSMLVFGALSDKLRVRKPLVFAAALASVPVDIAFLSKAGSGSPTFASIAVLLALTGAWLGAAYAPWMAAFTETVEHHNPALSATGLAIWGWILRVTIAGAVITIPLIVSAATPLVDNGPAVLRAQAYFDQSQPLRLLLAEAQAHPQVFSDLAAAPDDPVAQKNAIEAVGAPTVLTLAGDKTAQQNLMLLAAKAPDVLKAQADSPGQWRTWFWICTAGALTLCPLSLLLRGPWRPRPTDDAHAVEHALELANRDMHPAGFSPVAVRQPPEAGTAG